uniref:Uncharacterized protein n=1 Tax=Lactuca sativa TaxID=4236 RepID=A0A9R1UJH2_LACSA|nr:hypothetical protein LSAT_V11C900477690 [Lactuca sativa]
MASGDNRGSSGTSASLIRPMTALEETPPPIVVAGEVPDEGGSVVTVEPSGRQQQTAGDEHFPSIIVRLYGIDCMHWARALCPNARCGQYTRGVHREPTIVLEAIPSHDLRMWHAFFGPADANNDINVLDQS